MQIVVATPEVDCAAFRALRQEGVGELRESVLEKSVSYGVLFAGLWDAGEPFVLVEWDIVPWPGAIDRLAACEAGWCSHRYPLHLRPDGSANVALSFGIGKFRPLGPAPEEWQTTEWGALDGQVVPILHQRVGRVCVHEPPVAHARRVVAGT